MKDTTEEQCAESTRNESSAGESQVRSKYRLGDEIIFKFEGNLRARVEGYGVVGGKVWVEARAAHGFLVPYSQVIGVEGEERR